MAPVRERWRQNGRPTVRFHSALNFHSTHFYALNWRPVDLNRPRPFEKRLLCAAHRSETGHGTRRPVDDRWVKRPTGVGVNVEFPCDIGHAMWLCPCKEATAVEEPELDYPSSVPQVTALFTVT